MRGRAGGRCAGCGCRGGLGHREDRGYVRPRLRRPRGAGGRADHRCSRLRGRGSIKAGWVGEACNIAETEAEEEEKEEKQCDGTPRSAAAQRAGVCRRPGGVDEGVCAVPWRRPARCGTRADASTPPRLPTVCVYVLFRLPHVYVLVGASASAGARNSPPSLPRARRPSIQQQPPEARPTGGARRCKMLRLEESVDAAGTVPGGQGARQDATACRS